MGYSLGGKIEASDYNGFIGTPKTGSNALSAFTSEATANGKLGAVWGVGYRQWGWGQSTNPISNVLSGDKITATQWDNLGNIVTSCGARLNAVSTSGIDDAIAKGDKILFQSALASTISSINSNRLSTNQPGGGYTSQLFNQTRTGFWNAPIDCVTRITFGSGDLARYWFNTGSWLMTRPRHSITTTLQDQAWNTFLNTVGDIRLFSTYTTVTGSAGGIVGTSIGYYNLTSAWTTIYEVTSGSGAYSSNLYLRVSARIPTTINVSGNGDNGATVDIWVYLNDTHNSGWPGEGVTGGGTTVGTWGYRYTTVFTPAAPSSVTSANNFD